MESSKKDCCQGDCEPTMQERMNYFTGRHLAARDFEDEQKYHRTHRYLHNRMLHGWGVVCGLEVKPHKQAGCENRYVKVAPGMAIDCCGREIIVDHAACCGDEEPEIPWDDYDSRTGKTLLMLCLAYRECEKSKVPVLANEGDCSTATTQTKFARYKECSQLSWRWVAKADLKKYFWNPHCTICPEPKHPDTGGQAKGQAEVNQSVAQAKVQPVDQARLTSANPDQVSHEKHHHRHHPQVHLHDECPHDDCGEPCKEGFRSCIAPKCPSGHCVPLAVICVDHENKKLGNIIMKGRPEVPNVPQRLTHIVDINWPHGYIIPSSWLAHNAFVVTFDRKLQRTKQNPDYPGPSGVNSATFRLEYGEGAGFEDLDFVPFEKPPRLRKDRLHAEYKVDRDGPKHFKYLENHVIWITIKCDFLLDCHGVPVDGNNNGVPGGTFESWVYVVSDSEYEQTEPYGSDEDEVDDEEDGDAEETMSRAV